MACKNLLLQLPEKCYWEAFERPDLTSGDHRKLTFKQQKARKLSVILVVVFIYEFIVVVYIVVVVVVVVVVVAAAAAAWLPESAVVVPDVNKYI